MKFLLFGTGEYYNRYKIWFAKEEIIALIDNSKEKQERYIDDILVIRPEDIFQYEFDVIVILSFYVKAMKQQLMNLGVEESKIYHFFDLHDLLCHSAVKREIHYYAPNYYVPMRSESDRNRKILLLSHDLTLGGPALALYHAAQVLVKRGYQAVFGSMLDGPLRRLLQEEGIPVIIDENLMIATMEETKWINEYSLVICNTMNFHVFLSVRNKEIPVVWWLHDARFFYDGIRQKVMDKILQDNLQIWSVGPIPESAVKTFRQDFHVEDLLYGVIDQADPIGGDAECTEQSVGGNRKMRFITVGYIEHRKGQDILLEAIKCLEPDIRQRAEFFFVGENTSLLAKELIDVAKEIPEIVITGPVGREEIHSLFGHSDVLVCPSREDPMPTVAAEAMMHGVPCLLSDTTGTVKYIRDGRDGMIFQSGNAEQLKEILANCIQGRCNLDQMGRNARKVFEKYFSLEAFEVHFMELVERIEF
ncbi:MAG: glycosyltransferase family 4 protein [Dorea sp.]|nr:glycosyltransferase family 4 protein [Dorea sp.]